MSRMLRRPPATRFHVEPQQGPLASSVPAPNQRFAPPGDYATPARDLGRQSFGATDQTKKFAGASAGVTDPRERIDYTWQDRVQVNPAHEQPRLVFYSGAQPLIRWGLMRRFSRTYMSASPRFFGRWAFVGFQQRFYTERARLTGVRTRQGKTYILPRVGTGPGPRAIQLGSGS
jgi:hypothetical protein